MRRYQIMFCLRYPFDHWWIVGREWTTYWVRIFVVRIPIWRTRHLPYGVRRAMRHK